MVGLAKTILHSTDCKNDHKRFFYTLEWVGLNVFDKKKLVAHKNKHDINIIEKTTTKTVQLR